MCITLDTLLDTSVIHCDVEVNWDTLGTATVLITSSFVKIKYEYVIIDPQYQLFSSFFVYIKPKCAINMWSVINIGTFLCSRLVILWQISNVLNYSNVRLTFHGGVIKYVLEGHL